MITGGCGGACVAADVADACLEWDGRCDDGGFAAVVARWDVSASRIGS